MILSILAQRQIVRAVIQQMPVLVSCLSTAKFWLATCIKHTIRDHFRTPL